MDAEKTGKLIRETRTERRMTQQALADALHVSSTAVSKWENGHSLPDISLLESLSSVLNVSISDIVTGERSAKDMNQDTGKAVETDQPGAAIKSVIRESVRQRRRAVVKWVSITALIAALAVVAFFSFFIVGFPAKQENIRAWTEIQDGWNGNPEWVIHFETVDGRPLYAYTRDTSFPDDNEETAIQGRTICLRVAPLGHANPGNYTWGYSIEGGLAPTEDYDFYVVVNCGDGQVTYSMRDEGLFD